LNPFKTEELVTLAGTRQQVTSFNNAPIESRAIQFAGTTVSYAKLIRILGVTIDQHLTFDNQITNVLQSYNYYTRSLRQIRWLIDIDTANTLACSIVGCRLDYCIALWYNMTLNNFKRLQRMQNALARVVCNAPYHCSSLALLKSLQWLPVEKRIKYKIDAMTYKGQLPSYLL
jgi:hypothetical protein